MLLFGATPKSPPVNFANSNSNNAAPVPQRLRWIELVRQNHSFAEQARLREALGGFLRRTSRKLVQDALKLLVEEARDEFGRVQDGLTLLVEHAGDFAMAHTLRDHQAIDAVGGQVFHVAIEQASAAAAEHALAIANHGADCGAGAGNGVLADACGNWTQVGMRFVVRGARL